MLKNNFKLMVRGLRRHPGYAFINIGGLAAGLACALLIFLYVQDELYFDRFHEHSDRIHRVVEVRQTPGQEEEHVAWTAAPLAPALATNVPGVAGTTRLLSAVGTGRRAITRGDVRFYVGDHLLAEPNFFEVFGFRLLHGDPETVLIEPLSVVLTESAAERYFGREDPLGQSLQVEGFDDFTVTGVVEDPPSHSHLDFSMLFSFSSLQAFEGWRNYLTSWESDILITYVVLDEGADASAVAEQTAELFRTNLASAEGPTRTPYMQPITAIHFGSGHIQAERHAREGARVYLYVFSTIALFILLIACINYTNLATARSMERTREVGIRKVAGAFRRQLIVQYLGESILITLLALVLALGLVLAVLPMLNSISGKNLQILHSGRASILLFLVALAVIVGAIAGSYPALYLSKFHPARALKGTISAGVGVLSLRRGLVVLQFSLSIILIVATVVVHDQLDYVRSKELGFDRSQLVVVDINSGSVRNNFRTIKEEFGRIPSVQSVSVSSRVPGEWKDIPRIAVVPESRDETEAGNAFFFGIDEDFLETFDIRLREGRTFATDRLTDSTAVLLNEAAARELESGVGSVLRFPGVQVDEVDFTARVIGIVQDFHFQSLHEPVAPIVLGFRENPIHAIDYFTIRMRGGDPLATLQQLRAVGEQFDPDHPFEYNFLDERLQDFYESDQRVGHIFGLAALIAVVIACLGLFGLAALTATSRTKEIGVRKVLGATASSIVRLLSREYVRLVGAALVVAAPVAYFVMNQWLENFAYRVDLSWRVFMIAGAMAVSVAVLTVSYHAIRSALADPIKSLRYE